MSSKKDILITGSELAKRLGVSAPYITKNKKTLKAAKCTYGKKYYYRKSAEALGKDPDNPEQTANIKSEIQKKKIPESNESWEVMTPEDGMKRIAKDLNVESFAEDVSEDDLDDKEKELKSLLDQITDVIKDEKANKNTVLLNGLKAKANIIKEYFIGKREEIKYIKEAENLYEKEDVIKILGALGNSLRNALINLPNNYAVNLEGMTQKQIKDFVSDDINKMLEQIQKTGEQFD